MKTKRALWVFLALIAILLLAGCQQALLLSGSLSQSLSKGSGNSTASADSAVDEFGYNYTARIFVGAADGVDRMLDDAVWGDPTYARDHLVMKWSKGWDDARFHGEPWTPDAWENNEWNGMVEGGSGEVAHYKIIWVGPELESSPYWREGGYAIWGQFEVILDQGVVGGEHYWNAHAQPTGYGSN
jgi:hypothetical protein